MSKKGILEVGEYLDPRYDCFDDFAQRAFKGFWTPARYERGMKEDAKKIQNEMSDVDKSFIKKNILCVAMIEDKVKSYWSKIGDDIPQTMVSDVGALFGMIEVTHRRAYNSLNKEMDVHPSEVQNNEVLRDRLKYLTKHSENIVGISGKKKILKNLILFTSLVERGALFSYFYNLMSYANSNKGLDTIFALQKTSSTEELEHYSFGITLIDFIKQDYPELWDSYLEELVSKNIKMAYETEVRIVDWLISDGCPDHISRAEMLNFVGYNFNTISRDLDLDLTFEYDQEMYDTTNSWMSVARNSREPDFFAKKVGDYSSVEEDIDLDEFNF